MKTRHLLANKLAVLYVSITLSFSANPLYASPPSPLIKENDIKESQFQFCKDRPGLTCTHPGRGYEVCESYLNYLTTKRPQANACKPQIDLEKGDFTMPPWRVLEIREHMPLVYEIEKLIPLSKAKSLPFEKWEVLFNERIQKGEIKPMLKQVELKIAQKSSVESLLSYNAGISVNTGCEDTRSINQGAETGERIYILNKKNDSSVRNVTKGFSSGDLILFHGQPLLLRQQTYGSYWYISLRYLNAPYRNDPSYYVATLRCEFVQSLPKRNHQ